MTEATEKAPVITCRMYRFGQLQKIALILSVTAIFFSAFGFWPYEDNLLWRMFCVPNFVVIFWVLIVGVLLMRGRSSEFLSVIPHVSVLAYFSVNIVSIAFAGDISRAVSFTSKLGLILLGGYALLGAGLYSRTAMKIVYVVATLAVTVCIGYCLLGRYYFGSEGFGFFDSGLKYGTYVGILVSMCGVYLLSSGRILTMSGGLALLAGGLFSSGSIGMVCAISAAMVTAAVLLQGLAERLLIVVTVLICLLLMFSFASELRDDARMSESDGVNLKQRYIEWQAFLNLLERRWMTGTGAGCVNDYRSVFYYRLPKLNTIKAFDQNGYLATAAETGIAGLVCFCWVLAHYGKQGFCTLKKRFRQGGIAWRIAVANMAGFIAACTANLFSSVHYNGVLIVFVLVLVLIERSERVFDDF